jgi:acetyl-CoA synthetase (ADP-forming)
MDDALRVIRAARDYARVSNSPRGEQSAPPIVRDIETALRSLPGGALTESEAKALVHAAGIASPGEAIALSAEDAVLAARRIGYPVVLKAATRSLVHKSDAGAVKLGLETDDAVRRAWREIDAGLARQSAPIALDACVVQQMIGGGIEMILGAKWDAQFGALVIAGAGGVFVELLNDTALTLAPVTREHARELLSTLKIWPVLTGARGRQPTDVEALIDAFVSLGSLAHALGPRLVELDLNPLLVRSRGVVALDARATLATMN